MYATGPWFIAASGKLLQSFLLAQFFFNILSSQNYFYSGMVTREVKRGKRDFQDGATGRNAIKGPERKGN